MENKVNGKMKIKEILIISIWCIISSLLFAIAVKCFIQMPGVNMLAGGASGVALIISKLSTRIGMDENIVYSVCYVLINLPLFYMAFKRIGKWYTYFTILSVVVASILNAIIPQEIFNFMKLSAENDKLLIAIFAGVLTGLSTGLGLKVGASGGGVDIIITYMGMKNGKQVGMYNFWINASILVIGGILFKEWGAMLYTIIYIFVSSQVVDVIYRRHNKKLLKIVTRLKDEMNTMLIQNSTHGVTVFECTGAYTGESKYELDTVVLEDEVKDLLVKIHTIDPSAFISIVDVSTVKGLFRMPEYK